MEANELRIGNFVLLDIKQTLPFTHNIKAKDIYDISIGDNEEWTVEPIPLTEEWLIKFGFDKRREQIFKNHWKDKFYIGFNYGRYSLYQVGDVHNHWYLNHEFEKTKRITSIIRYVHQLQNLYFALTGKELEIK